MNWISFGRGGILRFHGTCKAFELGQNLRKFHRLSSTCPHHYKGRSGILFKSSVTTSHTLLTFPTVRNFSLGRTQYIWFFGGDKNLQPAIPPQTETPVDPIPQVSPELTPPVSDPTPVLDVSVTPDLTEVVTGAIMDPPFVEMGLASSWWPNHFVHQLLEWVHLNTALPWWATILLGTLCIRVVTLPLYIYTRKFTINYNNHKEEFERLSNKVSQARVEENEIKEIMASQELKKFFKETGTGPIKGLMSNMAMPFIFMSSLTAVRQMCKVPVPSLTEGGTLWFTNLAAPDPYLILPALTGATITMIIGITLKGGTLQGAGKYEKIIRKVRFLPILGIPLLAGWTYCGIHIYWLTTSLITLGIQRLLLVPGVREALKFPKPVEHQGPKKGIKDAYKDMMKGSREKTEAKWDRKQINKELKEREKKRKKELKGRPPVTYKIGVDAVPRKTEAPDFEQEWRPPRPKTFGYF